MQCSSHAVSREDQGWIKTHNQVLVVRNALREVRVPRRNVIPCPTRNPPVAGYWYVVVHAGRVEDRVLSLVRGRGCDNWAEYRSRRNAFTAVAGSSDQ